MRKLKEEVNGNPLSRNNNGRTEVLMDSEYYSAKFLESTQSKNCDDPIFISSVRDYQIDKSHKFLSKDYRSIGKPNHQSDLSTKPALSTSFRDGMQHTISKSELHEKSSRNKQTMIQLQYNTEVQEKIEANQQNKENLDQAPADCIECINPLNNQKIKAGIGSELLNRANCVSNIALQPYRSSLAKSTLPIFDTAEKANTLIGDDLNADKISMNGSVKLESNQENYIKSHIKTNVGVPKLDLRRINEMKKKPNKQKSSCCFGFFRL